MKLLIGLFVVLGVLLAGFVGVAVLGVDLDCYCKDNGYCKPWMDRIRMIDEDLDCSMRAKIDRNLDRLSDAKRLFYEIV